MKTSKNLNRLHLEKNTTRYRKMSGGTQPQPSAGNTPKSRGSSVKNFFGSIGRRFGSKKKNTSIQPQPLSNESPPLSNEKKLALDKIAKNRFPETSKFFRGIGKKFGLYGYENTPKQRLKGAVDELVKEIENFNEKTKTYSQYDINENDAKDLEKDINKARDFFKSNVITPSIGLAIGETLVNP